MRKNLNSSLSLGTFPSPGAGNFQEKGWCSERVPHPSGSSSRRHISALTPFYSGRTMPSKWEDAERWICSPVLSYGVTKYSQCQQHQIQRRPKSKSGPIVPPGISYYSNYSPTMQVLDSGTVRNFIANSPFSTGVLMPKGFGSHYNGGGQTVVARSVSGPGWSDLASESSSLSSQDEKVDGINDTENTVSRVISRRDMATQMSPEGSTCTSPRARSSSPPSIPLVEQSEHPAKLEIREVQVDKRATLVSRTTRHGSRTSNKRLPGVQDIDQNASDSRISSWDISAASSEYSKFQREEAKITAWENLQKAKAEAAIRKLEMKLEKKRSSSMDKILEKLRRSQIKAREMRSSISTTQNPQIPKMSHKVSFLHRHARLSSLSSCFTCRAP